MQNAPKYESAPLQLQPMIGPMSDANPDGDGFGFCSYCLIGISYFLVALTFPLSICCCMKVNLGLDVLFLIYKWLLK